MVKISELTSTTSMGDNDLFEIETASGTSSNKITKADMLSDIKDGSGLDDDSIDSDKLNYSTMPPVYFASGSSGNITSTSFQDSSITITLNNQIANNVLIISTTGHGTYQTASGSFYIRLNVTGANSFTSNEQRMNVSAASQRLPFAQTVAIQLANTGSTTVTVQIRGSATAISSIDIGYLTIEQKGAIPFNP